MQKLRLPARRIALMLVIALLNQTFFPTIALALTSGPTQPEVSSFTPAGTSDMVDLFSGDFQYNIPLIDVGGYPINISYTAGPGMDEEASWVGLGWNLNPGVINRQMRGIPDDFRGDSIQKAFSIRPDITTGIAVGGGAEVKGLPLNLSYSQGMYYNTYRGYGLEGGLTPIFSIATSNKSGLTAGLGLKYNSQNGLDLSPSLGLQQNIGRKGFNLNSSASMNSRGGLRDLSISYGTTITNPTKSETRLQNVFGAGGGSISFSRSTYTPTSELPLINKSFTFHGTVGGEITAINPHGFVNAYRSAQRLAQNRQKKASFGYLHSQLAQVSDVMDFNRERNGLPWREHMPILPPAFGTNDLFAASGQGASSQFRAIRNDIGYYRDPLRANGSESTSLGVELGFGNLIKVGVDVLLTSVNSFSNGWTEDNPLAKTAAYTDWDGKSVYEPVFFKNSGEMTMTDESFYATVGRTSPVQAAMESTTGAIRTVFQFSSNQKPSGKTAFNSSPVIQRAERERRNDVWQYLNGSEAVRHGLEKQIISYKRGIGQIRLSKDAANCAIDSVLSRTKYKRHHISEVSIVKPDGARYVYGLPAYNTYQKEVSFSVAENTVDNGTGLMQYDTVQQDNSIYNKRGRDQYYSSEVIPPYPYAFMLTGVLSPDYIDRTGNGITSDDYGSAVRINYSKSKKLFNWRTPYGMDSLAVQRVARYQPGRKSDKKGKKASYIYGTKEIWYVHSIESSTMLAQFYTSPRYDGLGAVTENGGMNTDTTILQKLDKIELYSKSDLQKYGNDATPIKTAHFQYNYELCPGVPNSNNPGGKGKLTLTKLWFTYGKSGRGKLNAYSFKYNNAPKDSPSSRFSYSMNNVDRWGNYKVNPSGYPQNSEYPYALQDTTLNTSSGVNASIYDFAGAWSLSQITLPSGGTIKVDYEPDDYAYVQNKRAGQMYFVKGFSRSSVSSSAGIENSLYIGGSPEDGDISRYVWVDLSLLNLSQNMIPDTNAFKARCLDGISTIWFNMDVEMVGSNRENITGYMDYDKRYPLQTLAPVDGNFPAVGIPVKIVKTDNNKPIHPITKAALQTMRLELPDLAYPGAETGTAFEAALKGLVGLAQTIKSLFKGFEANKMSEGNARLVGVTNNNLKTSWIRLCNPRFKKFGGGHRVKQITLNDNWDNMASGQPSAVYGQTYVYTTAQKIKIGNSETTLSISSGVASWEPTVGSEENLWKEPVTFNDKIKLAPDNSYYVEKPFGESLFPSAMVGYSEVKVQSIGHAKNKRAGSGWTINKYYTARDFPTIVDYSAPMRAKDTGRKLLKFFKIKVKDHLSLTQGFVVEVNDMHGKMKQEASYAQNGALISSTAYEYKIDNPNATALHLDNKVKVASRNGDIGAEKQMGVDVEVWQDFREETTFTQGVGFAANTDAFWAFITPIILFTGKALLNTEDVRFRSAVTTKYVKRSGILAKVTKMQDGSTITTENLLWDAETGAVLATKTQNEFEDPIYQFSYPAHWVYDGMGMAYKNAGARLSSIFIQDGRPYLGTGGTNPLPNFDQFFTDGDEFAGRRTPSRWVFPGDATRLTTYKVPGGLLRFYRENGRLFNSGAAQYDLFVLRSGRRNMAGAGIGNIVSKTNPLNYSSIQAFALDAANNKIVDASANTFRDLWQRDCNCLRGSVTDTVNPYYYGIKGNWRLENAYVNHRERTASKLLTSVGSTNIRVDGTNKTFVPFWDYVSGVWVPNPTNNVGWVRQSTTTIFDFKGNQNEEVDALGIFSMAQYGYQGNLNTAVAHNSRFRQSMAEGFEDYTYDVMPLCDQIDRCDFLDHAKFDIPLSETGTAIISDSVAHSGKYSYRLGRYETYALGVSVDTLVGTAILQPTAGSNHYTPGPKICRTTFKPTIGSYLVSGWIYTGGNCYSAQNGPYIAIAQKIGASFQTVNFYPSGPVIEGWQRVYGKVEVTIASGEFQIRLVNTLNKPVYFDDVRFHPWLGNMKSFVYDPISLRLMAVLDENNYASFYEYDDEGMLIRVKRETERGIMTIEEHRSSLRY